MEYPTQLVVLFALASLFGHGSIHAEERILFSSEQSSGTLALHSIRPDGSDVRLHVAATVRGRGESEGAVSPDGKLIAYTTYQYGGWKIGIADLDGSNKRRLTMDPQYAYDPQWAPDGKSLIYRRIVNKGRAYFQGNGDIFRINLDGSGNENLSRTDANHDRNPAYSPDGQKIVFDGFVGEALKLFLMNADSSGLQSISGDAEHMFAPSWSPDGQWIAHLRASDADNVDVWVMKSDGSEARNLTNIQVQGSVEAGEQMRHWLYETSWSQSGKTIAFVADYEQTNNADIYTVDVETGNIRRLTTHSGFDLHPSFFLGHDGRDQK